MTLAVCYNNGLVFQHYGKTRLFKLYNIEDGKIISTSFLDAGDYSHESLATLLKNNNVSKLICGNLGDHAVKTLSDANIEILNGNEGSVEDRVKDFLDGKLKFDPKFTHKCNH